MGIKRSSILKWVGGVLLLIIASLALVILYRGFASRAMPDLKKWHSAPPIPDNLAQKTYNTFSDYLAEEKKYLKNVYDMVSMEKGETYNRYNRRSICSPYYNGKEDLNASFQYYPPQDKQLGGILLVHGLSDSPYHLRAIADIFKQNGYYVICLRLPGHGTIPGALSGVTWEEWYNAVKFGANMVRKEISKYKDPQFFVGGFSTGGALTLRYVLETLVSGNPSSAPRKLFLFSPAIGVSPFAAFADWNKVISWMPWFKKFKWADILPEYDPYKYNSFSKNAGSQVYKLTLENESLVKKLISNKDKLKKMPPIYAFQSIADATVNAGKLIELMDRIGTKESELVIFDIDHTDEQFFKLGWVDKVESAVKHHPGFPSRLIVVSNKGAGDVVQFTQYESENNGPLKVTGGPTGIGSNWPEFYYSLSHVCIPIAPEDTYYGKGSKLGELPAKGEKDILNLDSSTLIRIRYNPFFSFIKQRIEQAIGSLSALDIRKESLGN